MDIKKSDSKGRLLVDDGGNVYSKVNHPDGRIELFPIAIPEIPLMRKGSIPAVYVSTPNGPGFHNYTITIHSVLDSDATTFISELANRLRVPVVLDCTGVNGGLAQMLKPVLDRDLILVNPHNKKENAASQVLD